MNESRFAVTVGLFVTGGLILLALLLLTFSKGLNVLRPTYELRLRANTVGGLKRQGTVLMSGVSVGRVAYADVAPDGHGVVIGLRIYKRYRIYGDARFSIEQLGFLGDQYVAIYPQANAKPELEPGAEVRCEDPLNIQEIVRAATGLIQRVDQTVKTLQTAADRLDRTVLSENSLSNVSLTLDNFQLVSARALGIVEDVNRLVDTNGPPIFTTMSNLVSFSEDLNQLAGELKDAVITNKIELTKAIKNLDNTTHTLDRLVADVEGGKGLAGSLLKDERLKRNIAEVAENFAQVSANLATLTSNLNKYGLLYKPKPPKTTNTTVMPFYPGKNPFKN